ncbi:hypothetical protein ACZ90_67445 [Streptomyces albus subsp. albus]|nr:hypothetical protein ACZ90_67445 [Streptomyces albus subsp. albus]
MDDLDTHPLRQSPHHPGDRRQRSQPLPSRLQRPHLKADTRRPLLVPGDELGEAAPGARNITHLTGRDQARRSVRVPGQAPVEPADDRADRRPPRAVQPALRGLRFSDVGGNRDRQPAERVDQAAAEGAQ